MAGCGWCKLLIRLDKEAATSLAIHTFRLSTGHAVGARAGPRVSAADLAPDAATAGRRIRAFTEGVNHHRPEGTTHCILCVVIVDKCCPLGFL